jgi:phosphoglycerate dehydrogenase-like enzyme
MVDREKVLLLAQHDESEFTMMQSVPHVLGYTPSAFVEAAGDATTIFTWAASRDLLQAVFAMCPKLRWIHSRSAGLDGKLFPELVNSPVLLTNGTGVFSSSLGEFALTSMLYFAKDIPRMRRNQAAGIWAPFDVEEIAGRSVGIVGYGDIGRAVASRAHSMGMRVLAVKRHFPETPDPLIERYYRPSELHEMLSQCDYIVVTAPLTEETRHMISEAEFAVMKSTAVLINIGRGAVIDEVALLRALTQERIKGAGLDVFEQEPLPAGHPLYRMENVLLSPHCADNTGDWKVQAMRFFLEQYDRFQKGEPLLNVVNKQLGY